MNLSKTVILRIIKEWFTEWERYILEGVIKLMHDVVFEN